MYIRAANLCIYNFLHTYIHIYALTVQMDGVHSSSFKNIVQGESVGLRPR